MVIGPNGCGKSTLIKIILHKLAPVAGSLTEGYNVHIGYYDQENQNLTPENTVLDELWNNAPAEKAAPVQDDFTKLTTVQKVFRVQEVIDKEIRPLLELDGGSIELVDLNGNNVIVRLTGRCSSCPSAGVTLKYTVQDKLREFVSSDLTVESI